MASQVKLFERCPPELLRSRGVECPVEPCSADDGGLRSDHPDDHARISDSGAGSAMWRAAQRLSEASTAPAAAADHAESVARSATDNPLLRQAVAQFLRRFQRWNHLPGPPARPDRDWRTLLEDAARGLLPTASPAHLDMKGAR